MMNRLLGVTVFTSLLAPATAVAQANDRLTTPYPPDLCPSCAAWNEPRPPFRIHGNTWFVGTRGLSALLITSDEGHILIDGGLPDSAPHIIENIRTLGFNIRDVRLLLNSHVHYDHAGGIAALQQASGARVAASGPSAAVLHRGAVGPDDPQFGVALDYPAIRSVQRFDDGDVLQVGPLALTAHRTAGHTPGGTTWTWQSCDDTRCLAFVYADSQTPVSADEFRFTDSDRYPSAIADFQRGFALLESLPCDILVTPHPSASSLWERLQEGPDGLVDPEACHRYAAASRQRLQRRIRTEAGRP